MIFQILTISDQKNNEIFKWFEIRSIFSDKNKKSAKLSQWRLSKIDSDSLIALTETLAYYRVSYMISKDPQ